MCGITGWINYNEDLTEKVGVIERMTDTLRLRGPDDHGYYISNQALLGHRRLTVIDPEGGIQPMTKTIGVESFTIVYNGELYNTEEIRKVLVEKGYSFKSYSDTEVLLTAYIAWGPGCLDYINGIFAFGIWDETNRKFFMARDPLGVKPLFYASVKDSLVFGSEIKALLAHPSIQPIVNQEGLLEIFGLGPARTLGHGVFKAIKEVPPAHYVIYDANGIRLKNFWKLEAKVHEENIDTTIEHTKTLVVDAIKRQLVSDVPVCTFLSGGLDSSAISTVAASVFRQQGKSPLNTFSIDYKDNAQYFKASAFQPNSDKPWVRKMVHYLGSQHHYIELAQEDLVAALKEAVLANDLPGMADIDSSLYLFCQKVKEDATVALSGECADEIFGGYPWYTRPELIHATTFPWSNALKERKAMMAEDFKNLPLEDYVQGRYHDTLRQVPKLPGESLEEQRMRELFYLNIKWFMITLLTRKDRMSMANSLEVRVPFADYRIVEYGFNLPRAMKFLEGREKGLLRRALKEILPEEIVNRKKSPYPKTHHPLYTKSVVKWMGEILEDSSSPLFQIVDKSKVKELVETEGKAFKKPWFGQLMKGPQLIAFLIQIDIWMREYCVIIE